MSVVKAILGSIIVALIFLLIYIVSGINLGIWIYIAVILLTILFSIKSTKNGKSSANSIKTIVYIILDFAALAILVYAILHFTVPYTEPYVANISKSIDENKDIIITAENMTVTQEGDGTYKLDREDLRMVFTGGSELTTFIVSTEIEKGIPMISFNYGGNDEVRRSYFYVRMVDTKEDFFYKSADFTPIYVSGRVIGSYFAMYEYGYKYAQDSAYKERGSIVDRIYLYDTSNKKEKRSFKVILYIYVFPGETVFLENVKVTGKK